MKPATKKWLFATLLIAVFVLVHAAFSRVPGPDVAIVWWDAVPDPSSTNRVVRSPATVHTHTGTGPFLYQTTPLTFTPKQQCWVNGREWVLRFAHRGWFWCDPDYATVPITIRHYWDYSRGPAAVLTYVVEPEGKVFQAPTIRLTRPSPGAVNGGSQPINFRCPGTEDLLGGQSDNMQYQTARFPGVYGVCDVSAQAGGAPGMLYGWSGRSDWPVPASQRYGSLLPPYFAWTWDGWVTGLLVIGPDPYATAARTIADANDDGAVSVDDIFTFLGCYFASDRRADVNRTSAVNEADLLVFFEAWFQAS
jgi:hypothetical protein